MMLLRARNHYMIIYNKVLDNRARSIKSLGKINSLEAALQKCFYETVFLKYTANLPKNTHADL